MINDGSVFIYSSITSLSTVPLRILHRPLEAYIYQTLEFSFWSQLFRIASYRKLQYNISRHKNVQPVPSGWNRRVRRTGATWERLDTTGRVVYCWAGGRRGVLQPGGLVTASVNECRISCQLQPPV